MEGVVTMPPTPTRSELLALALGPRCIDRSNAMGGRGERAFAFAWPCHVCSPSELASARSEDGLEVGAKVVHAKLVVRDQAELRLTSANLNPAAFETNVEAGVHLMDAVFARQVATEVDGLIGQGVVVRVP